MKIHNDIDFTDYVTDHAERNSVFEQLSYVLDYLYENEIVYQDDVDMHMDDLFFEQDLSEGKLVDYITYAFPNDELNRISPFGFFMYHNEWHKDADEILGKKGRIAYCAFPDYLKRPVQE